MYIHEIAIKTLAKNSPEEWKKITLALTYLADDSITLEEVQAVFARMQTKSNFIFNIFLTEFWDMMVCQTAKGVAL